VKVALTIAGSDSGGGAGVLADAKTFQAHGVWATVALTAVTAQNTIGVSDVHRVPGMSIRAQIEAVAVDIGVDAAKTGLVADADAVEAVARAVRDFEVTPLVVDPVVQASTGHALASVDTLDAVRALLVPLATVVTPNLDEAASLVGGVVEDRPAMEAAARWLTARGASAALITGGHLPGPPVDCLVLANRPDVVWLEGRRVEQVNTHGTGCVLSAAVAANLALGADIETACRRAKGFVARAIAGGVSLGRGQGPVDPAATSVDPAAT